MSMEQLQTQQKPLFDYQSWAEQLPQIQSTYQAGAPFPHIVLDNFLEPWAAQQAMEAFPSVNDEGWIHYLHFNEKKHGLNKSELLPPFIRQLIGELNSPQFLRFVEDLTGIQHLMADPSLEGGGLHQSRRGGFLNIHADFTVHPHQRNWRRRVNLLIYLNEDWKPEYKGDLELWDQEMKSCHQRISPIFNRCVIFNTEEDSFHGLPDPIECPEEMTRKSIALYYFTEESQTPRKRTTNYQARPEDRHKAHWIYLDKWVLNIYSRVKSTLGLDDDFASKLLRFFNRK